MQTRLGKSSNIQLNQLEIDICKLWRWEVDKWVVVDFYPNDSQHTLKNDNFNEISFDVGVIETTPEFKVPFAVEGQQGTLLGNYLVDVDLKVDYHLIEIDGDLYSLRDKEVVYGNDDKGILLLRSYQMSYVFDWVICAPNGQEPILSATDSEEKPQIKGYVGKIIAETTLHDFLNFIFEWSLFNKRVPSIGYQGVDTPLDTTYQAKGWGELELEVEDFDLFFRLNQNSVQYALDFINDKYDKFLRPYCYINENGLINIKYHAPQIWTEDMISNAKKLTTTSIYNEDYINNYVGITPDAKYFKPVKTEKVFLPMYAELVDDSEEFLYDGERVFTVFETNTGKYTDGALIQTLAVDDILLREFIGIKIGDDFLGRTIKAKKFKFSNGELTMGVAFDTSDDDYGGNVVIDVPTPETVGGTPFEFRETKSDLEIGMSNTYQTVLTVPTAENLDITIPMFNFYIEADFIRTAGSTQSGKISCRIMPQNVIIGEATIDKGSSANLIFVNKQKIELESTSETEIQFAYDGSGTVNLVRADVSVSGTIGG